MSGGEAIGNNRYITIEWRKAIAIYITLYDPAWLHGVKEFYHGRLSHLLLTRSVT